MWRAGLAALVLYLTAGPAWASPGPAPAAVTCSGGETLAPLVRAWARGSGVGVAVDADARLAAEGFARLLAGRADCVSFVREPFPREMAEFRARFGHDPLLVPVARGSFATRGGTHAIAVYVNAANPVRGLTLAQLRTAFSAPPASGPAHTWGDLGVRGAWARRPLHLYGMLIARASGDPPGVVNFLRQRVLRGAPFRDDIVQLADRPGDQALAQIVERVAEDPGGLGYSGFGYAAPGARAVPIASAAGGAFVAGTPASVADGRYPLARRIYILVDRPPRAVLRPELRAFLAFILSPRGQRMITADREGFLPLTPPEAAAARRMLR